MAVVYKCKQCGGDVEVKESGLTGVCLYCGTEQTLPKEDDEQVKQLLIRANDLRLASDFDRAIYTYEKVIAQKEDEPEAHWGLLLSKYGVEYVRDSRSFAYKPTLHRISSGSVFDDVEYKATMRYASPDIAYKYKKDAEELDQVMKELLVMAREQEPYDIFLSYKEADDLTKKRTDDSFLAHDLYNELTAKGYKVFFAPKSLGVGLYEPKIYAAMLSSKIMIVLGTKSSYFDAVWVKNEWSRYIEMIEKGEDKILIPVYKYMDASELPNKLAKYQAYDMDDISFLPTLINLIEDNIRQGKPVQGNGKDKATNYFVRASLALSNGNYIDAARFYDQVLNEDPHSAKAYAGKLMCDLKVKSLDEAVIADKRLAYNENFCNAMKFGDGQLKASLLACEERVDKGITEREEREALQKRQAKYNQLISSLKYAHSVEDIEKIESELCETGYKDAFELSERLKDICHNIKSAHNLEESNYRKVRQLVEENRELEKKNANRFIPAVCGINVVFWIVGGILDASFWAGVGLAVILGGIGFGIDLIWNKIYNYKKFGILIKNNKKEVNRLQNEAAMKRDEQKQLICAAKDLVK